MMSGPRLNSLWNHNGQINGLRTQLQFKMAARTRLNTNSLYSKFHGIGTPTLGKSHPFLSA